MNLYPARMACHTHRACECRRLHVSADATTTLTYDPVGALKSVTDPDGVTITYSYDDAHRLIDVANGLGEHPLHAGRFG